MTGLAANHPSPERKRAGCRSTGRALRLFYRPTPRLRLGLGSNDAVGRCNGLGTRRKRHGPDSTRAERPACDRAGNGVFSIVHGLIRHQETITRRGTFAATGFESGGPIRESAASWRNRYDDTRAIGET